MSLKLLKGEIMKLKYRGVSYDYNPSEIPIGESTTIGQYRGVTFHFHKLLTSLSQLSLDLKYRGVSYHTGPIA